jgi:tripartite-type tricarboxylate transporter receptor subunit TctC
MKFPCLQFLRLAVGVVFITAASGILFSDNNAWSQTRTIKLVVPYPPGGAVDFVGRVLAEEISKTQGSKLVIEDRPGAGSVIGTEAVSRSAPDGNTLLIVSTAFVVAPHFRKLSYNPLTSFEPICSLVSSPVVIVVNDVSPYHTLADLLSAARIGPGRLTMGGAGPGTTTQIGFEMLRRAAGVNMIFIPFPGSPPAVNALLGEHVTSALSDFAVVAEQIKTGKLRALATTSGGRIKGLPDVPTVGEFYSNYAVDVWYGLFAPAKTPKQVISQFAGWFTAALQVPEVREKLSVQGLFPVGMCGADFGDLFANNTTNTAVSFAKLTSVPNDAAGSGQSQSQMLFHSIDARNHIGNREVLWQLCSAAGLICQPVGCCPDRPF